MRKSLLLLCLFVTAIGCSGTPRATLPDSFYRSLAAESEISSDGASMLPAVEPEPAAAIAAQRRRLPPGQLWLLFGSRHTVGGKAAQEGHSGAVEPSSFFAGFMGGYDYLGPERNLAGSHILFLFNSAESDTFDTGWHIWTIGAGEHIYMIRAPTGDLYVSFDIAYTHWGAVGSDPNRDFSNYDGLTLSGGVGADILSDSGVGLGLQMIFRYSWATHNYTAAWADLALAMTFRF